MDSLLWSSSFYDTWAGNFIHIRALLDSFQIPDPENTKRFSCSTQLSMKFSLLILKCQQKLAFSYLLAEKFSGSATFSKEEFAIY